MDEPRDESPGGPGAIGPDTEQETDGRDGTTLHSLDLYSGIAGVHPTTCPELQSPAGGVSGTRPGWIELLWSQFPPGVQRRYEPGAVIGEGGMGIVLEAEDRELERPVAIKGLRDPSAVSPGSRRRQEREYRIAARLTHPNILPVFDVWADRSGNPWCSMLRVPGDAPSLARHLDAVSAGEDVERRPVGRLLEIFLQVCRAVAYAHSRGVVHRDLKPANVLLGPSGEALVCDWGVARAEWIDDPEESELVGTPGYAAPEQLGARGQPSSDARSDVYSLGVMLFEMIAGLRPARARPHTAQSGALPIGVTPPELPSRIPRELAGIIRRASAWEPADRFDDAAGLLRAIEAYLAGGMIEGLHYSFPERIWKWARAHPLAAGVLLAAAFLVPMIAAAHLRGIEQVRTKLMLANQNLAMAHTGWAAEARKSGLPDQALHHAALALRTLKDCSPGWTIPSGTAYSLVASPRRASRLAWACTLDFPSEVVEFSPDGKLLHAVTRKIGFYRIELESGRLARQLAIPRSGVWGVTTTRDGSLVASIGTDKRFDAWRTEDGQQVLSLPGHTEPAWAIAFTPDGQTAVTGGFDRVVRIWDVPSGRQVAALEGHAAQVWSVAVSSDGRLAASGDSANQIRLWDVGGRRQLHHLSGHESAITALAFSAGGDRLASGDGGIRLWDVASGKQSATLGPEGQGVMCLAFDAAGGRLAAGRAHALDVWDVSSRERLLELRGHTNWLSTVRFSPDGKLLASTSQDRTLRLWHVGADAGPPPFSGHTGAVVSMAFSADGRRIATAAQDGSARIWDALTGRELERLDGPGGQAQAIAFDAAGAVHLAGVEGGAVQVRSGGDSAPVTLARIEPDTAGTLVLSPGAARLAAVLGGRAARVWDCPTGTELLNLPPASEEVNGLTFSPDGGRVAYAVDRDVFVHELPGGRRLSSLSGHTEVVMNIAFSPDGRQLATGGLDFDVRLWDVASGASRVLGAHGGHVWGLAFSDEGKLLASGGLDAKVMLWQLPSGARLAELEVEGGAMYLDVSPDGRKLLAAGDGGIQVWDIDVLRDPADAVSQILRESFFTLAEGGIALEPRAARDAAAPRLGR